MNLIIITGRVGKDAEQHSSLTSFSIATTERWKDKEGNKQEETTWHNIVTFRKLAELCAQYVTKGMLVSVQGKLTERKWQNKEGVEMRSAQIVADKVEFLSKGKEQESEGY